MTWTQIGAAVIADMSASTPSNCTPNYPTGTISANDVTVVAISYEGGTSTTVTPPAGWTLVEAATNQLTVLGTVSYWKLAAGGEGGTSAGTWAVTSGQHGTVSVTTWHNDTVGFAGAVNAAPAGVSSTGSATSIAAPAVTTTNADCLVLHVVAGRKTSTFAWDQAASTLELSDHYATNVLAMQVSWETAGVTTVAARTVSTTSAATTTERVAQTFAFAPTTATAVNRAIVDHHFRLAQN